MGFREDDLVKDTDNSIEGLAEELNHLNEGIRELVNRRSSIRKELGERLNIMSNRVSKLDDIYFNLTRGEEGMPEESTPEPPSMSEIEWAIKAKKDRRY